MDTTKVNTRLPGAPKQPVYTTCTLKCTGAPSAVIDKLRWDASLQQLAYGFAGDPADPVAGRYYGYLLSAGEY